MYIMGYFVEKNMPKMIDTRSEGIVLRSDTSRDQKEITHSQKKTQNPNYGTQKCKINIHYLGLKIP